ncbi:hypothetical protein NQZ68_012693 [Dissostichus eleginoides]|nr:hypothetical protein NQZ68_012693 [Dissostichus eleginoides]
MMKVEDVRVSRHVGEFPVCLGVSSAVVPPPHVVVQCVYGLTEGASLGQIWFLPPPPLTTDQTDQSLSA